MRCALIVVTHQCGYSPLPDCLDCLVRPRSEINKISQAKYCVWLPLIEVLEHCIESGQIGVKVTDDGNSMHRFQKTACVEIWLTIHPGGRGCLIPGYGIVERARRIDAASPTQICGFQQGMINNSMNRHSGESSEVNSLDAGALLLA
jgi:hypothetical protein